MHKAKYLGKGRFKCEMCAETPFNTANKYRLTMGLTGHIVIICRKCVYREMFGSKFAKTKMKEGVLDVKTKI